MFLCGAWHLPGPAGHMEAGGVDVVVCCGVLLPATHVEGYQKLGCCLSNE
jgi:hypothetical protein